MWGIIRYILRSISNPNFHTGVKREDFFQSLVLKRAAKFMSSARALVTSMEQEPTPVQDGRVRGLPCNIYPNRPPKNFRDAMSREDRQEWAEAYASEHQGFFEHKTLKIVRPEPGAKILGTTTRTEYKVVNGVFKKRKVRLCVMGNQQKEGILPTG